MLILTGLPTSFLVQKIVCHSEQITLFLRSSSPSAACPLCGQYSHRVHSRYLRTLNDLPCFDQAVQLRLICRRFVCLTENCPRQIFAERWPALTSPYAHTTQRLDQALRHIAFTAGGEAGARLARRLHLPTSADTLLRRLRHAALPKLPPPRVIGVDEWAFRKGQRYGTILCDLERRAPIELLPARSAATVRDWLKEHPQVEVISRDRAGEFAKGASAGAPQAQQVVDRWHLLKNVRGVLQRVVRRLSQVVRQVAKTLTSGPAPAEAATPAEPVASLPAVASASAQPHEEPPPSADPRWTRYQQARELKAQGLTQRVIATRLDRDRATVRRYLRAEAFPELARRRRASAVARFLDYLRQRWQEGCRNGKQLTQEIQAQGFRGSYYMVRRRLAYWRGRGPDTNGARAPPSVPDGGLPPPSARGLSWWLLQKPADLPAEPRTWVTALREQSPELNTATQLAQEFSELVRHRQGQAWESWLARAKEAGVAAELQAFAAGLQQDEAAVRAALESPWSNGQVEGQVNRLKTSKRQMYGRANLDLLRQRVLQEE